MNELIQKATILLESNSVQVVIGYGKGSANRTRAIFITQAADCEKLIFDSRCIQNLAVYLTKQEIKKLGKPAIVAPIPVLRSIVQLAAENQIAENDLVVLGVTPESELVEFESFAAIETFLSTHRIEIEGKYQKTIEMIKSMPVSERFAYWVKELEPCFKCYACRSACPLCYCTRCTVENNQPQWISVASHPLGNLEWHVMRAMHLAGRCTDCEACYNACPMGIPIHLLTKSMLQDVAENFGTYGPSLDKLNALSSFKPDDKESFIR
ncbi:MAG: 4Fe-4S dicluster domain-containing protein [Bacteroidia bacterium]|nr:4Fe-4S dicluster domain-containing protein [Bacteroidia bacterium]